MAKSQDFAFKLKEISLLQNTESRTAMDFFDRGKSDSYINLHETLQDLQVGVGLTSNDLRLVITRLQNTQKMRKSPSLARMLSESQLASRRHKKSTLTLSSSLASLRSHQRAYQNMSLAPIAEQVNSPMNGDGYNPGVIEEMENEIASPSPAYPKSRKVMDLQCVDQFAFMDSQVSATTPMAHQPLQPDENAMLSSNNRGLHPEVSPGGQSSSLGSRKLQQQQHDIQW